MNQKDKKATNEENGIIKKLNEYSDKKLSETLEDDRLTNVKEQIPNIGLNAEKDEKITAKEYIDFINKLTVPNTTEQSSHIRPDNIRIEAFIILMIILKDFFKKYFGLNFSSFKCQKVLGPSIAQMRKILNMEIYQILCYYKGNKKKIIEASQKLKNNREKRLFYYFMTRTYEELYSRYISGDINFPLFVGGTVRICGFTTLAKEIEKKKEKLRKKDKKGINKDYIEEKMRKFEKLSLNMINDIKEGNGERRGRKEKIFNPKIIPEFESWRKYFKDDSNGISLEE
mgnify:FL=1